MMWYRWGRMRAHRSAVALTTLVASLAARAATATELYVSTEDGGEIAVVDVERGEVVAHIAVGKRPRGVKLSRDGKLLYVALSGSPRGGPGVDESKLPPPDRAADGVGVVDLTTRKLVRTLPSGQDPESFDLSPDGKLLYVSNENDNMVSVVDVAAARITTEIAVGVEPEGMGISPDGKTLVNTSETTSMAHFIDTASHEVIANVLVDSRPRVAKWTADAAQVWVSSEVGGSVSVIDSATHKVVKKIRFAIPGVATESIQPVGIALTNDRKTAFVALGPANRVAVVDAQTFEVKKYLLVGQRVWQLAFSPDEQRLYTTNGVSNDMSVIDVPALKVTKSVPVGRLPWGVVVAP